jgi:hypothetical protein
MKVAAAARAALTTQIVGSYRPQSTETDFSFHLRAEIIAASVQQLGLLARACASHPHVGQLS